MVFYKNYGRGHFGATLLSIIGGICGLSAIYVIYLIIKEGYEPSAWIAVVIGIAGFFGFRKLADIVYKRKLRRMQQK